MSSQHRFGGDWTEEKLEAIRKYLMAYTKIMSNQKFRFAYVDAFAGTGYRNLKEAEDPAELMFPELAEEEPQSFLDGSARIALKVSPRFHKYIFIEKDETRCNELEKLKHDFPSLAEDIIIERGEANAYLQTFCSRRNWKSHRAILFLDPYGMQVQWATVKAIAETQAIDLWILFPLGVAVNRLLRKDGTINQSVRDRLDEVFGSEDWYDHFYQTTRVQGLFGDEIRTEKTADFDSISEYFINRLKTIFAGVVERPLQLRNSRNNALYLLCFAAGNPKGASTAVKIAQHILGG